MKRTNLILDEELLKEAKRLLEADSYSATVNLALEQAVKIARIRGFADLFGKGAWSGDFGAMRDDRTVAKARRRRPA